MHRGLLKLFIVLLCVGAAGIGCRPKPPLVQPAAPAESNRLVLRTISNDDAYPDLPNLLQVTDRIYSGAQPQGEAAFAQLQQLGVKTIVSVDGARPQVDLAQRFGLRYVHIPIGYDGISDEAGQSIARAIHEVEGPIYFHCHHGKHRGPAAAAVACIAAGATDGDGALEVLHHAGTSAAYAGLWRDVENYQPPASDVVLPELVSVADVGTMTAAMAKIDRAADNLALAKDAKWSAIEDHPDIVASHEALILREALHETGRHLASGYDEAFANLLKESESIAIELGIAINNAQHRSADEHFDRLVKSCTACHVRYRD